MLGLHTSKIRQELQKTPESNFFNESAALHFLMEAATYTLTQFKRIVLIGGDLL